MDIRDLLKQYTTFTDKDQVKKEDYDFISPLDFSNKKGEEIDPADFAPAEESVEVDGGFEDSEESARQQDVAYSDSGIPTGPEGGFRAGDVQKTSTVNNQVTGNQPVQPKSPYERYLEILQKLQKDERDSVGNINLIRGGNQIAQAIASGYGGKIGDGSDQLNKLQEAAKQPKEDYLQLLKTIKDQQSSPKSPIGFGQFVTVSGDPVSMLSNGGIWNNAANRMYDETVDGKIIPRATDRIVYDSEGNATIMKPGVDTVETIRAKSLGQVDEQGLPTEVVKKNPQTVYEARILLPKALRANLDKDVDQFQQEIKEALRVKSEIDNAGPTLDEAKTNPAAARAVGALIAQIFQGGRLSDTDIDVYVGRYGAGNWLRDTYNRLAKGTHTPEMLDQVKEYIGLYSKNLEKTIPERAKLKANTMVASFPKQYEISPEVITEAYYSSKNIKNKVKVRDKDGNVGYIPEEKLQEALKRGAKKVE